MTTNLVQPSSDVVTASTIEPIVSHRLVLIDAGVDSPEVLAAGVLPDTIVLLLERERDGIEQITEALQRHPEPASLHLVSHGAPGKIYVGNTELSLETLDRYSSQLMNWTRWLAPNTEFLIYGCEVAKDKQGRSFVVRLGELTGANIAASVTKTGAEALDGGWNLEVRLGKSTAPLAFQTETTAAYASVLAAGDLDLTFGIEGKVTTDFNGGSTDGAHSVALQIDGKIVVVGSTDGGDYALSRYNSDGSLDTSFGINGKVTTDFNGFGYSVALQSDGKIVVAGASSSPGSDGYNFALSRYNSDGSLDTSFGTNGKVTTDFNNGSGDYGNSVVLQSDGKIIVAGSSTNTVDFTSDFAISRYNSDGSLDTSFGTNGKVTTDFNGSDDYAVSVIVQSDGKIVVAGFAYDSSRSSTDFALSRYNSDGSLDTSFGINGKVTTDFNGLADYGSSVILQSDGKIIVVGSAETYAESQTGFPHPDFALSRYNSDGSLDTSFGINGKVTTDFNDGTYDGGASVIIQSDGRIIVAGGSSPPGSDGSEFALIRYNSDGSLDTSFGTNGKVTTDFNGLDDYGLSATLQPDGNIILVGSSIVEIRPNPTSPRLPSIKVSDFAIARYLAEPNNTPEINDEPAGADNTVTTVTNTAYTFTANDFGFSDPKDIPINNLLAVKITTLPTNGSLTNNGIEVKAGDFVSAADIAAGNLKFTPVADTNGLGYASFTFQIQDDGGTANGGIDLDQTPNTITIDVASSGSSTGDPHITTFDGLRYDFQAQGDFILVKALDSDLEVQVRQAIWSQNPDTTLNVGLATVVDGKRLEFSIDQPLPLIDGVPLSLGLGESQSLGEGSSISRSISYGYGTQGDLYTITYANGDQLLVNVFANFLIDPTVYLKGSQTVVGLLGNNNGQIEDDLALREGAVIPESLMSDYLSTTFASIWRVAPRNSLFGEPSLYLDKKLVKGTTGSDVLTGGAGNDILVGTVANRPKAGSAEIDLLTGYQGADKFVLGDKNSFFYANRGANDYALIQDFNRLEGDTIQLKGSSNDYVLGSVSTNQGTGTGIFLSSAPSELIGIIEGVQPQELSLSQPFFRYV